MVLLVFFLMIRLPPRSTRTDTLFPYTTLFRSLQFQRRSLLYYDPVCFAGVRGAWRMPAALPPNRKLERSEEHTSELQSLMRISYAVFCLKKKNKKIKYNVREQLCTNNKHTQHQRCHRRKTQNR